MADASKNCGGSGCVVPEGQTEEYRADHDDIRKTEQREKGLKLMRFLMGLNSKAVT